MVIIKLYKYYITIMHNQNFEWIFDCEFKCGKDIGFWRFDIILPIEWAFSLGLGPFAVLVENYKFDDYERYSIKDFERVQKLKDGREGEKEEE